MDYPKLYRRRFIPDETVLLKDDEILHFDADIIVTKWRTLKPRRDFSHGLSCYHMNRGFKVSKFMDVENRHIYTYCDIVEWRYQADEHAYYFNDLLADVIVYNDGFVRVLDVGELPEAYDKNLITVEQMKLALARLDELLQIIYSGKLDTLTHMFNQYDDK